MGRGRSPTTMIQNSQAPLWNTLKCPSDLSKGAPCVRA